MFFSAESKVFPPERSTSLESWLRIWLALENLARRQTRSSLKILLVQNISPLPLVVCGNPFRVLKTSLSNFFPDPPWPPGKPTVKDVAKTSCFLMWTKPEHDGGAKIDGYVIEMLKSGTMDWIRVADNISFLEYFLKGLMEKQEYSFRVRAVNVAGESEPSEPSDPVLCKERLSKKS